MIKGATARRYAEAVFEIGREQGTVERWLADLRTLAEYFGNKRLLFVLSEPKIPAPRKDQVVRDLLAGKVQPEALNLALLLVERGLAPLGPAIFQAFERRYNDYKGIAVAQVTTAIPLDDTLRAQIAAQLGRLTGKSIQLQERVDPAILGGAIARVGDTLIDGSLRRRFELLRQQIAAGNLGGPDDGQLAAILGSDGAMPPFAVTPAEEPGGDGAHGSSPDGNAPEGGTGGTGGGTAPPQATEMAPRGERGNNPPAHLGPKPQPQPQAPPSPPQRPRSPGTGGPGNTGGGRRKRRKR